jgi:hypothetical protein
MIIFRKSILAAILKNRATCTAITIAAVLQLSFVFAGLPAWSSPFHVLLGLPDPGCGLSRAIVALLRGEWRTALTLHAFAPLFLIALNLIALATVLPAVARDNIAIRVEELEHQTGLTALLLMGLVVYWLARLLILREAFLQLIAG